MNNNMLEKMNRYKLIPLFVILPFANLLANDRNDIINQLISSELENQKDNNKLHISWIYSGDGGAIRYAELDLIGDEEKEIIYDRTTRGNIHKIGKPIEAYYQSKPGSPPVKIDGEIQLHGFYKKEGEKSIFLKASEGRNFDTPNEKAFTPTLTIQEVTTNGVTNTTHVIDANSSNVIQELWKSALLPNEKKSIDTLKNLGFTYVSPKYSWVSLKDFVAGDFEWKDYNYNNWSSLDEFTMESMTWEINEKMITPEYLKLARQASEILKQNHMDDWSLELKSLDLPPNYLTPQSAYRYLIGKMPNKAKEISTSPKEAQGGSFDNISPNNNKQSNKEYTDEDQGVISTTNWPYYIAGILLLTLVGGFIFLKKK